MACTRTLLLLFGGSNVSITTRFIWGASAGPRPDLLAFRLSRTFPFVALGEGFMLPPFFELSQTFPFATIRGAFPLSPFFSAAFPLPETAFVAFPLITTFSTTSMLLVSVATGFPCCSAITEFSLRAPRRSKATHFSLRL